MIRKMKQQGYDLLRKSEKYTKTDMVYLAKGGSWLSISFFTTSVLVFIQSLFFANILSAEAYGTYKYVLTFMSILSLATLPGIRAVITNLAAENKDGSIRTLIASRLRWGLLSVLGAIIISLYYFLNDNYVLGSCFLIVSALLLPFEIGTSTSAFLIGKKRFKKNSIYEIVTTLFSFTATTLSLFFTQNIIFIIGTYFLSFSIVRMIFFFTELKKIPKHSINNNLKDDISFGKHLSFIKTLSEGVNYIDKILVFTFLGSAQLAYYSVASAIPDQLKNLGTIFRNLSASKFSSQTKENIGQTIFSKYIRLLALFGFISLIYILLAPYFFKVFFPQYQDAVLYTQFLALGFFAGPNQVLYQALNSKKMKREINIINISIPILRIVLYLTLLPLFQLWGLIFAHVFSNATSSILSLFLLSKTPKKS